MIFQKEFGYCFWHKEQLGITQKTAWFLNHRIREMLKDNDKQELPGVVAVDETFVGGKNKIDTLIRKHFNHKVGRTLTKRLLLV